MPPLVCTKCQYDLTGLPSSAPCPECGQSILKIGEVVPRRKHHWAWSVLIIAGLAVLFPVVAGLSHGNFDTFATTFFVCAVPALIVCLIIALANLGVRAQKFCGFCGYDRVGLTPAHPCPECGQPGNIPNAPGHKAVGARHLPTWIWLPAVLTIPMLLIIPRLADGPSAGALMLAMLGGLLIILAIGGWHAWKQAG